MKDATYAPMYCALYPQLAGIARKHGYALAVHGTLGRDMDLICIPWIDQPSEPEVVVSQITSTFAIKTVGDPDTTLHGRERWTISIGFGECFIDLSFMPRATPEQSAVTQQEKKPLTRCASNSDGDCSHPDCPQLRDNEPHATGRHCPIDTSTEDEQ